MTINKASLNATVDNLTKIQGNPNPTLTLTYTGFVNGETTAVLTRQAVLTTTATTGSAAGSYPITFSTNPTATNYTITTVNGTLTVLSATYDWTGVNSINWSTPQNWSIGGVQQTVNYPGTGNADVVHIGVAASAIVNQPTLAATTAKTIATLVFGNAQGATTLTVNTGVTLTISNFTINANTTANLINNGPININQNYTTSLTSTINLSGSNTFSVALNNITNNAAISQANGASLSLNANSFFSQLTNNGALTQNGTGTTTLTSSAFLNNRAPINQNGTGIFNGNAPEISNTSTITQSGATGTFNLNSTSGGFLGNITNSGTITQSGGGTMAITNPLNTFFPMTNSGTIGQTGAGTITFAGDFTNSNGSVVQQTATATGALKFTNAYINQGGTTTFGPDPSAVFFSDDFTNTSGTTTFGTGLATFNSGASAGNPTNITMTPNASLTFINVAFNTGHYALRTGNGSTSPYILASSGIMTLSNAAVIDFTPGVGLKLKSDATGSATIATIPANCTITASNKVSVERFIQGSADITKRGYRLLSSTVYTATPASAGSDANAGNSFDLQYLRNSNVFLSGANGAANGFNMTSTNNPTIYLFREDETPPPTINTPFTTGYNWKGVTNLTGADLIPSFATGTTSFGNQNNVFDQTVQLPVGNGVLFFFRGGGTTNINYYTAPFANPADGLLTQKGTLNTGTITVKLWYNYGDIPYTTHAATTAPLSSGFALVGNPYPSTINLESYNNASLLNGMTGTVTNFFYEFNEASKQYGVYQTGQATDPADASEFPAGFINTNSASNYIASGQGFFATALPTGGTLTFNETAKINTQPNAANFLKFMGKPKATASRPTPFLHLNMNLDSANYDDIVIKFNSNASTKFDKREDAVDVGGNAPLENLSSLSSDSVKLAINTMPFPGLQPSVVKLFAGAPNSGTFTMNVAALKMPQLYKVWLKDSFTGDSVDLKKTTKYSFTIDKTNAATFGANRFTVVFSQDTANAYRLLNFTPKKWQTSKRCRPPGQPKTRKTIPTLPLSAVPTTGKRLT